MSISRKELIAYINQLSKPELFKDYAPNGLQVEGTEKINTVVTAVTASHQVISQAVKQKADVLLVHHGFFWQGESPVITGMKKQRIAELLHHDINLLAYHLPLDAHTALGNNVQLAHLLNIDIVGTLDNQLQNTALVFYGNLIKPCTASVFGQHIMQKLGREPLIINGEEKTLQTIAWCTGAAQDFIQYAIDANVDAFITGEVSERTYHAAMESGICFIAAGHHATERYGIQALGEHIKNVFDVAHIFIDEDNPV